MAAESAELARRARQPRSSVAPQRARRCSPCSTPPSIKGLTRSFIGTVAANGRARELVAMATAFLAELASRRGETTVAVTSAVPLSPAQLQQLNDSLRSVLGSTKVSIDARVEPEILGGLVVKVGSRLFDSSIRSKLQRLQLAMKGLPKMDIRAAEISAILQAADRQLRHRGRSRRGRPGPLRR